MARLPARFRTRPGEGWHDAQLDFSESMSYGDYLSLDSILSAQHPLSPDHNEMLFIMQHQTSELWMKLALYELRAALAAVHRDELPPAFKMLARVSRIIRAARAGVERPRDDDAVRIHGNAALSGRSSGFQSHQYRQIEFLLGNKNEQMLKPHAHRPDVLAEVTGIAGGAFLLRRSDSPAGAARLSDFTRAAGPRLDPADDARCLGRSGVARGLSDAVRSIGSFMKWRRNWSILEDAFRQWRFRHVTTVERIIGFKQGTGGTSGAPYLRKMLDVVLFPELWHVRTVL